MIPACSLVLTCLLAAGPDPAALLQRVDDATRQAKDSVITLALTVQTGDSRPLERTLKVWQRGRDQRMVKFLAPGRLRGTGILVPDMDRTLLYLPAYKRVRRIVGAQGSASFMGTGFSIDDLARTGFSPDYTATIESSTDETWVLRLTPKDPKAHDHASVRVTARRSDHLVTRIETFDAGSKPLRTITAGDFRANGAYTIPHQMKVVEHKSGRVTTARIVEATFDTGLSAATFTERSLTRAP